MASKECTCPIEPRGADPTTGHLTGCPAAPSKEIMAWGDDAMYSSQKMLSITPKVILLNATADPLGALAAGMRMYRGDPVYNLSEIDDDERKWAWEESIKTHLKAPWEFIDFQFMIEGVTRAFTHQIVRQRTAVYAQESLRFAVKEDLASEIPLPPSVVGNENAETFWHQAITGIEKAYHALLSLGIPAEDARGLLPHATTTRLIYKTNFRGLMEHAGMRLCTQAQFEWRHVIMGIMKAIKEYETVVWKDRPMQVVAEDGWQFELIATARSDTFAPVCYQRGKCVFMGELDRGCTIRDRVIRLSDMGCRPSEWGNEDIAGEDAIDPAEWAANPRAGITDETFNPRPE